MTFGGPRRTLPTVESTYLATVRRTDGISMPFSRESSVGVGCDAGAHGDQSRSALPRDARRDRACCQRPLTHTQSLPAKHRQPGTQRAPACGGGGGTSSRTGGMGRMEPARHRPGSHCHPLRQTQWPGTPVYPVAVGADGLVSCGAGGGWTIVTRSTTVDCGCTMGCSRTTSRVTRVERATSIEAAAPRARAAMPL